jgi:hypothetical protein
MQYCSRLSKVAGRMHFANILCASRIVFASALLVVECYIALFANALLFLWMYVSSCMSTVEAFGGHTCFLFAVIGVLRRVECRRFVRAAMSWLQ